MIHIGYLPFQTSPLLPSQAKQPSPLAWTIAVIIESAPTYTPSPFNPQKSPWCPGDLSRALWMGPQLPFFLVLPTVIQPHWSWSFTNVPTHSPFLCLGLFPFSLCLQYSSSGLPLLTLTALPQNCLPFKTSPVTYDLSTLSFSFKMPTTVSTWMVSVCLLRRCLPFQSLRSRYILVCSSLRKTIFAGRIK